MRKRNFPNSKASVMKVIKSCIGENGLDDERIAKLTSEQRKKLHIWLKSFDSSNAISETNQPWYQAAKMILSIRRRAKGAMPHFTIDGRLGGYTTNEHAWTFEEIIANRMEEKLRAQNPDGGVAVFKNGKFIGVYPDIEASLRVGSCFMLDLNKPTFAGELRPRGGVRNEYVLTSADAEEPLIGELRGAWQRGGEIQIPEEQPVEELIQRSLSASIEPTQPDPLDDSAISEQLEEEGLIDGVPTTVIESGPDPRLEVDDETMERLAARCKDREVPPDTTTSRPRPPRVPELIEESELDRVRALCPAEDFWTEYRTVEEREAADLQDWKQFQTRLYIDNANKDWVNRALNELDAAWIEVDGSGVIRSASKKLEDIPVFTDVKKKEAEDGLLHFIFEHPRYDH